ncbi:MAG TPA: hypothetical protein VEZ55_00780, partial [Chitinophagaceae bacterium]|nr:hypothetical protein [Chitinophagaceae bacterium]
MMKLFFLQICSLVFSVFVNAQVAKTAAVKQHLGRPALFVNDKVEAPAFYSLTHAYGGRWSWEEVAQRNIKIF